MNLYSCFILTLFSLLLLLTPFAFLFCPRGLLFILLCFLFLFAFCFLGCRLTGQCGNCTQTAPGTPGWDLFYEAWLPSSFTFYAADGQQCHPWADCSSRHQQNQFRLGSHCRPDSLHWVLQVGGALIHPLGSSLFFSFLLSACEWSKCTAQNGTVSDLEQAQQMGFYWSPIRNTDRKSYFS